MRHSEGYRRSRGGWEPTQRQREVLDALVDGQTNAEIAVRLGITVDGAKWHVGELLAQTGLADRQALASWWVEERARWLQPAFLPWLTGLRRLGLAVSLALLTTVALLGWLTWGRGGGGDVVKVPEEQSALDEGFISGGPIRASEPLFKDFLVELAVETGNGRSRVDLRDIKTGEKLGSVDAGYRPMVLVRKDAQELLVSSGLKPEAEGEGFYKVLQVYDLRGYSLQLKRTIETPDRINCTTYCQPMVLSRDERYVYYGKRTTAPECGAGGDASVCDVHAVVRIDLSREADDLEAFELRRGCGVPILSPAGESGVIAMCRGQYPVNGGWSVVLEPGREPRTFDFATSRLQIAHVTSAGEIAVIGESGAVTKEGTNGQRTTANVLPTDMGFGPRVFFFGTQDLGDDRLFIVFDDADFGPHDRKYGFVVFDLRTMKAEGHGRVPEALTYLPQGEWVFVLREGRVEVLDLKTGSLKVLTDSVGGGVEVLLPGE